MLINLTPHEITVVQEDGNRIVIPPSGTVARVITDSYEHHRVDGIPVMQTAFGAPMLPDPLPGVVYIVSTLVLQACKANHINRDDLVAPDTSPSGAVRDADGKIVGVKGFQIL